MERLQIDKRGKSMSLIDCKTEFYEWLKKHGYGNCDLVIREWRRQRVNPERDKRQRFPKSEYQRLFDSQKGFCACGCSEHLLVPAIKNEIDHIDPNRQDFNHRSNLQLLLPEHNRNKSSKSVLQQSKESGRTMQEIIKPGFDS